MVGKLNVVCGWLALIMVVLVSGCQTLEQKELARLQGEWKSNQGGDLYTFSGNNFIARDKDEVLSSGTFKINIESDPKEIDIVIEKMNPVIGKSSADEETVAGETYLGIYKIEGNKLFIKINEPGDERPVKFEGRGELIIFTKQ